MWDVETEGRFFEGREFRGSSRCVQEGIEQEAQRWLGMLFNDFICQEYRKLTDTVFPILMEGMEQLSKEVEVLIESKEEIDPEVR